MKKVAFELELINERKRYYHILRNKWQKNVWGNMKNLTSLFLSNIIHWFGLSMLFWRWINNIFWKLWISFIKKYFPSFTLDLKYPLKYFDMCIFMNVHTSYWLKWLAFTVCRLIAHWSHRKTMHRWLLSPVRKLPLFHYCWDT